MIVQSSKTRQDTHLSYCTNIHAGATWEDAFSALQTHIPKVRDACNAHRRGTPFGIGLRLSQAHLETLEHADNLDVFLQWMRHENLYVYTINGFPSGAFHGEWVKADVYRPDWTEPERLDYTCRLVELAAQLGSPDQAISISTLPGTYKPWAEGAEPGIAAQLLDCIAHCMTVEQQTGVFVSIAIEPEPCCLLETAAEVVDFFARWFQTDAAQEHVAHVADVSKASAGIGIRRHLGVCHDVCHSAVEFESALAAIERYALADIPVLKIQLSSALRLDPASEDARRALAAFDEPVYLHQVVRRNANGELERYSDIHEALERDPDVMSEWRVHFHVPVFLASMEAFGTTQNVLAELLDEQAQRAISCHLEIETYTWDVLPAEYRNVPIADAIARELDWVHARLTHTEQPATA